MIVGAKNLSVLQLFISRMPKMWEKVKSVGQLSADSIPTVNRQLTNSKPTLKNLTSLMTSQTLDPYRSIRISRMMYHKLS